MRVGSRFVPRRALLVGVLLAASLSSVSWARAERGAGKEPRSWFSLPSISQIGVIEIEGPIYGSRYLIREIKRFGRNPLIKALVLRIDSPGGGVGAVQEVVGELKKFRDGGKKPRPIVASFGGVAASGGYYIACAASHIVSNPGALTGSIGVIMEFPDAENLLKKIGVKYVVVKSGRYKDTGSFTRGLSDDELRLLQDMINDVYEQFLESVWEGRRDAIKVAVATARGRGLKDSVPDEEAWSFLRSVADGRVLSGRQALKAGLVDELGGLDEAIDAAMRLSGTRGRHVITAKRPRREPTWWDFLGSLLHLPGPAVALPFPKQVSLQYLLR